MGDYDRPPMEAPSAFLRMKSKGEDGPLPDRRQPRGGS
jgi:hypothetical protein